MTFVNGKVGVLIMNKKGASELISYVLIIGLSITLAIVIGMWSKVESKRVVESTVKGSEIETRCAEVHLGGFGYIGAFIAGILFVSTFTVATGAVILLILAEQLHPIEIGLIAGFGAVLGDLTIFRFVKDNLTQELESLYNQFDSNHHLKRVLHSKYFSWSLPVIGAIIIASPFPDELGISILGFSKIFDIRTSGMMRNKGLAHNPFFNTVLRFRIFTKNSQKNHHRLRIDACFFHAVFFL